MPSGAPLQTWLDSIASIKDATANDALFVMKDGTEQRLAFVTDFRVLYVSNPKRPHRETRSGQDSVAGVSRFREIGIH